MDNSNMIMTKSSNNVMRSKAVKNFLTRSSRKSAGPVYKNRGKGIMAAREGEDVGGKLHSWEAYHENPGKKGAGHGAGSSLSRRPGQFSGSKGPKGGSSTHGGY